jgi:hypothetical protein
MKELQICTFAQIREITETSNVCSVINRGLGSVKHLQSYLLNLRQTPKKYGVNRWALLPNLEGCPRTSNDCKRREPDD